MREAGELHEKNCGISLQFITRNYKKELKIKRGVILNFSEAHRGKLNEIESLLKVQKWSSKFIRVGAGHDYE